MKMEVWTKDWKKISKFLSYILRHHPEEIGLTIDDGGSINVTNEGDGNAGSISIQANIIETIPWLIFNF